MEIGKQSLRHPEISTGYLAAFLARSDSILLSLYLVLWVYSYDKSDYDKSSSRASALSGITYTIIMFSCILYGFLYERKNVSRRNNIDLKEKFDRWNALFGNDWRSFN